MKKIFLFLTLLSAAISAQAQAGASQCVSVAKVGTNIEVSIKQTGTANFELGTSSFVIALNGLAFTTNAMGIVKTVNTAVLPGPIVLSLFSVEDGGVTYVGVLIEHNNAVKNVTSTKELMVTIPVTGSGTPTMADVAYVYNSAAILIPESCPVVVPVELMSFSAEKVGEQASVKWTTAKEKDLKGYAVQRSVDGINFKTLETVAPTAKDVTATASYNFVDAKPELGINYYRLEMNDLDGTTKYSKTASVDFGSAIKGRTYPNPVVGDLSVEIDIQQNIKGDVNIQLLDMTGKVILTKNVLAEGRRVNISLPTADLVPGTYIISMKSGNDVWHQKITKN